MIRINKRERDYLASIGLWYGENGISRTYSHNKSYYLCESKENKKALRDYYEKIGLDPRDIK